MTVESWRSRWADAGVETIPAEPSGKRPLFDDWQVVPPSVQWESAPGDANLAAYLTGDGVAVLDGDTPESYANVGRYLSGLGVFAAQEETPSGGGHVWFTLENVPPAFTLGYLLGSIGKGELRFRNCVVIGANSTRAGRQYQFTVGAPEDLPTMRPVSWKDMQPLISWREVSKSLVEPPVPILERAIPFEIVDRLWRLEHSRKGQAWGVYRSRSHLCQSVICQLILRGKDLPKIESLFLQHAPRYSQEIRSEMPQSYQRAVNFLSSVPEREELASLYAYYETQTGSGRGSLMDWSLRKAMIASAWVFGSFEVYASGRDLAMQTAAGMDRQSILRSLHRLTDEGFLQPTGFSETYKTARFEIQKPHESIKAFNSNPLEQPKTYGMKRHNAELESSKGLGRAAMAIYQSLENQGKSILKVAKDSGRVWRTAQRQLHKLEGYGLAEHTATGWVRGSTTLDAVAKALDVEGLARARRRTVDKQREDYETHKRFFSGSK